MSQEPCAGWGWGWWQTGGAFPAAGQHQQVQPAQWIAATQGGEGQAQAAQGAKGKKGLGVRPGPDADPAQGGKGAKGQAQAAQGAKGKKGLGVCPGPDADAAQGGQEQGNKKNILAPERAKRRESTTKARRSRREPRN